MATEAILFLHPTGERSGPGVVLTQLVRGLDRARWRAVVALPAEGPLARELRAAGAVVELGPLGVLDRRTLRSPWRLARFAVQAPRAVRFVRRLVKRHAPALVHTSTAVTIGGALGARASGVPHLWHLHEIFRTPGWAVRAFARAAARLADVVVSNSHATRGNYDRHAPELAARHRVVHDGVDRARLGPTLSPAERRAVRHALDVGDDQLLVVLAGTVNRWKGHRLLIEAAERLRQRHPDTRFLLVGDAPAGRGALVRALRQELAARNLAGFVDHVPHREDVGHVLQASDVVVVPSTEPEPFGLVAAEAMAVGRPVVAAAHGGLVEVVEAGVTGLLFEPRDVGKLTWALQVLIEDRARAREMGRRGAQRHRERFTAERMQREMDLLWCQAVDRRFALTPAEAIVVHVVRGATGPDVVDGVGRAVHRLAETQAARGLDVRVLTLDDAASGPLPARSYPLERLPARGRRLDRALARLVEGLPPTALAHLHGGDARELRAVARALARRRVPYVVTPHGAHLAHPPGAGRRRALGRDRRLLRGAARVQASWPREREALAGAVDAARVVLLPVGQDLVGAPAPGGRPQHPAQVRRPLFGVLGPPAACPSVLGALLDAFALHCAAGGEGTLWLVGDGPRRGALAARAEELGLARRVAFHAVQDGAGQRALLAALDVLVDPAWHGATPWVVLEAAALGRPVVVTEASSAADDLRAAGAGPALAHTDAEALAAALAELEREWRAGTLAPRGASARALVAARFDWQAVEDALRGALYGLEAPPPRALAPAPSVAAGRAADDRLTA